MASIGRFISTVVISSDVRNLVLLGIHEPLSQKDKTVSQQAKVLPRSSYTVPDGLSVSPLERPFTAVLTAVRELIAESWNQARCPTRGGQRKKIWYYVFAQKKKKPITAKNTQDKWLILIYFSFIMYVHRVILASHEEEPSYIVCRKWTQLQIILPGKVSQFQKDIYCMFSLIYTS